METSEELTLVGVAATAVEQPGRAVAEIGYSSGLQEVTDLILEGYEEEDLSLDQADEEVEFSEGAEADDTDELDADESEMRPVVGSGGCDIELAAEDEDYRDDFADFSDVGIDDAVSLYLRDMAQVSLLSSEDEVYLAKRMESGRQAQKDLKDDRTTAGDYTSLLQQIHDGELARDRLIRANTRLVVSVAKRYRGNGVPFLDLIQEGNMGLMRAVDKFDYHRGHKFSTYATWWIRQAITRALSDQGRTIRLPVHMGDRIRRVHRVAEELEQKQGQKPTPEEIAQEMELEPHKVRWMLRVSHRPYSLEKPVGEDEDSELGHFIEDVGVPSPSEVASSNILREKVEDVLSTLTPREARILRLRFGLHNGRSYTLEEVGRKFGLTRERIRQIQMEALRKLRHPCRSRQLKGYLS